MLFNLSFFVYFGTIIPWNSYFNNEFAMITPARLIFASVMILVFKRLPMVLAVSSQTPSLKNFRESIFTGWFGPSGVGSIFYCMVITYELKESGPFDIISSEAIFIVITSVVVTSIIVHGVTIALFYLGTIVKNSGLPVSSVVHRAFIPTAEFLESVLSKPYRRRQAGKARSVNSEPPTSNSPLIPPNASRRTMIPYSSTTSSSRQIDASISSSYL